jgi:hypothetical protein
MRQGRFSHGTVVAYVALFVALGGSAYATVKITGKQVKDGSLTSRDVKDRSLLAQDFKEGLPAGAQGPQGPKGESGANGTDGAPGAPGTPGTAAGYIRVNAGDFAPPTPGVDSVIASPGRSKNVLSVRRVNPGGGATFYYCFDLTFVPEVAVGSAFANNGAFVSTATARDYGTQVAGCPVSEPDAKAVVYDAASATHADVSFSVIFEQPT